MTPERNSLDSLAATRGPLMGLDLGTRTIGIAVSDGLRMTATGLETLHRTKLSDDLARLAGIARGRGVAGVVLGMPVNMDGRPGPRAQATRAFARDLERALTLPVAYWDERLSTAAAERTLIAADSSRKRRAEVIDTVAAIYILQGALDRLGAATSTERTGDT